MILFFDTETTGVPKNYKAPVTDLANWPRIIQFAWAIFTDGGLMVAGRKDLIKPDGWVVPTEKFWIDNGFSHEQNLQHGIPIAEALAHFIEQIDENATVIAAHNLNFDLNITGAEMIRHGLKARAQRKKVCTMLSSTDYCKIPGGYGKYKWPKLIELHLKLFGVGFDGAHDALEDVKACARCYFELQNQNVNLFA